MGMRAKSKGGGLIHRKAGVLLTKLPREGVSTDLDRAITDQRPGLDLSERARTWGLIGGPGESVTYGRVGLIGQAQL
jgi:hypothetical protein